jgi:CubicO group peptidase (beta-lactamase class C family)
VNEFAHPAGLLEKAIAAHAFPAASVEVGRAAAVTWRAAFGRLTYAEDAPHATEETIFDLASLTKVIVTTTLVMQAVDAGTLALTDCVADRLSAWRGLDRETVTIADLLEHASGLTAYLPFFRDHHGRSEFERAICTLPLECTPRTQSIYSDLGFILLGFMLEDVNHAPLAEQFQYEGLRFNPPREWRARTAPTELDLWRGRLLQGEVHDENTWALGGAAGHAGLFGTAAAVGTFARLLLRGLDGSRSIAHPDTLARFTKTSTVPGSSRALGWDTMLTTSSCGTRLSRRAIGHTGFTGTSLWLDPEQDLYIVLLTNRVHPTRENNAIQSVRRAFHDSIVGALGDPAIDQPRSS